MGYSEFDPAAQSRAAGNAGKTVGTKRPLTQKQIWAIRFFLDREGRLRDRALFDLAIDSKLRGCDLVKIMIGDLVSGSDIKTRAISPSTCQDRRACNRHAERLWVEGRHVRSGWHRHQWHPGRHSSCQFDASGSQRGFAAGNLFENGI